MKRKNMVQMVQRHTRYKWNKEKENFLKSHGRLPRPKKDQCPAPVRFFHNVKYKGRCVFKTMCIFYIVVERLKKVMYLLHLKVFQFHVVLSGRNIRMLVKGI